MNDRSENKQDKAKKYNRIKIIISLTELGFTLVFILLIVLSGLSLSVEQYVRSSVSNPYLVLIGFVLIFGLAEKLIWLPVDFYSGYMLEHRYGLSNQSFGWWVWELLKANLVSAGIGLPLLLVFYWLLRTSGSWWWLPAATVFFLFSVVMARLAPVLIMPLFYKFTPLEDEGLKEKLTAMGQRVGFTISGVFRFNLSKNTKKANAGLTGLGRTRRIILADTLLEQFTPEEIETVFAHELGHYTYKHIPKLIAISAVVIYLGLYITGALYALSLPLLGFAAADQPAALPLLALFLVLFGLVTMPLQNAYSRKCEREADRAALKTSSEPEAFITALEKLTDLNLGDRSPHPVIEFLFYSHPSVGKRVRAAKSLLS